MAELLIINSPKRKKKSHAEMDEFFPYYAGFPEDFATSLIQSAYLPADAVVFDPWNGSGTTTYSASQLGFDVRGIDINPVMVIVACARNINQTEAEIFKSGVKTLIKDISRLKTEVKHDDPLLQWFTWESASMIRNLELRIRRKFFLDKNNECVFNNINNIAASYYVALFNVCRSFTRPFQSSNPTWLKLPKDNEKKIQISIKEMCVEFEKNVNGLAKFSKDNLKENKVEKSIEIAVGDTTSFCVEGFADLVLTSPPYCTRIDYTSATRIELAVIYPMLKISKDVLSRSMIGSVRVPITNIYYDPHWGRTCCLFLDKLVAHESKASHSYYRKTHMDYFDKIFKSLKNLHRNLKSGGIAVLVVQDSYYKEIHNDLPKIFIEMAENIGLSLFLKKDFLQSNSISKINSSSQKYRKSISTTESVICFKKGSLS